MGKNIHNIREKCIYLENNNQYFISICHSEEDNFCLFYLDMIHKLKYKSFLKNSKSSHTYFLTH